MPSDAAPSELTAIPNVGPAVARKLRALDVTSADDLRGRDAEELFERLCAQDGRRHDVGTGDNFYNQKQLLPENFERAVKETGVEGVEVRYQPDYDHSYFFISSFAEDHVQHAAKYLL